MPDIPGYGATAPSSRGIFDSIGSFFNTALSPVGIKPFPGGPYADAGKLDQAQGAMNNFSPITDLGALSGLPQMYSQLAQQNGLPDPFSQMIKQQYMRPLDTTAGGAMGQPAGSMGVAPQYQNEWWNKDYTPSNDPYALSSVSQRYLNQKQSDIGGAHNAEWQRIKANLSARGLGDSSTMDAARAYLDQAYGNQGQEAETSIRGAEFDRKQQIAQYLANALTQLFNAQRQHSLDQAGIFQNQGALSAAQSNNNMNFFRSLFAPFASQGASSLFGGGGGGGGVSSADIFG
jgi:hypothetical protein